MRCRWSIIALFSVAAFVCASQPAFAQQGQEQSAKQKKAPARKARQSSLTGCIDQQEGRYVLIHDQSRGLLASLEADGFPPEGFAKYLGHKVTVRGTSSPAGAEQPVFKVRSIEAVADSCGPQEL